MKFRWLLPSTLSLVLLSTPASAGRLQSWQFDADQNRLVFTTDEGVQPRARLLFNPTRLVIDLPSTTFDRRTVNNQSLGGAVQAIRVGRVDRRTTRLVIELKPGFTLDPQQVIFRGTSPRQWTVQLPTPQPVEPSSNNNRASIGIAAILEQPPVPRTQLTPLTPLTASGETQVQDVQVTPDGFFIRTTGGNPQLRVRRSGDRTVEIDLKGAVISSRLSQRDLPVDRFGVSRLQLSQVEDSPPVTRVTLQLTDDNSNWLASVSNLGGVVLLPATGAQPASRSYTPGQVRIESVELSPNQLLVRANQPFTYTSGWDRASGAFRIAVAGATLDDDVDEPRPSRNSPVLRVRVRQEDPSTVAILVQPAAGVQLGEINQPSPQLLSLPLTNSRTVLLPPTRPGIRDSPAGTLRDRPTIGSDWSMLSSRNDGRMVVVIDAGHGGRDPGAIGIGGLREVDVITPIALQVASQLEQQGIQVVLTRRGDYFVDLAPRVQIAKRANADLFVSIHANAVNRRRPDVNGIEVYHFGRGEDLARTIHASILQSVNIGDRGVRRARFFVLRNNPMPAVLVEVGFVTGDIDAPKLSDPAFRSQMADAIARGILLYIRQNF
ncbi:N-acetylmuramoyl-L-alanine amidase [Microseira sp. BLCC-F43]|uniref:N-acetylmuramoyl-L-alanine amidase n=1 Tax=Microseira sp. BLCC-F43 TaxID=3153602 RepID=UPI0035B850DB